MERTEPERIALSVSEAAAVLGVSRPTVYQLMRRADFPAFQIGTRRLISRSGLEHWVQTQAGQVASDTDCRHVHQIGAGALFAAQTGKHTGKGEIT